NVGLTSFTFTVTLSSPTSRTITVDSATADGTASAPLDYLSTSGTLTFQPRQTSQTITVQVVGDVLAESNETFFVNLSNSSNAPLTRSKGTGTILNDDTGFLHLDGEAVAAAADVQPLTQEELAPIVAEAEARWAAAGMGAAALAALSGVEIRIADLPDTILGETNPGVITIDASAAGHGWFIDPTPADDAEFAGT